jgi:hypothetical protein
MDEVECIFTKHFASNDRKKAMKFLKPQEQKGSHMVTFFVGNCPLSLKPTLNFVVKNYLKFQQ